MKLRRIRPSADAQKHLQVSILLLEVVNSLEIPIQIVSAFVPRVTRVVDILVGPRI